MINYATRNDYDKISALIFDGNNHVGSGCFLWSRDNSELYCITAYHCTYNTEEKTDYNVRIQYYVNNQLVEPSIVGDRVFEAKDDIAIYRIKVDQYTKQIPHIMISDLSSPPENVVINGFPRFNKCKRCEVRVDYKSNIHGIIYLEAPTLDSNKLERYDEVVGLSGSGCYEVIGNTIKLIGIQNKAINKDVPFKELQGITVEAINKILLANNLPQLPVPIAAFITKPIGSYKPIEQALADYSFKNKWAELDIFQTIKSNVKRHMFSEAMSMYLCGMSGIGKTRGVLYAFKQAGYHNVVYYNSFKNFDNEKHKLQQHTESTNEKFYIIIDEVDFKDFSSTNSEFQFWGDCFKFIFIGTVSKCQMDISCEDTIYLDLIQRKDIIKVISEQYPMFSSEEQEEIYQLSHNDLRLAILISRLYFNDENNSNEGSMPILRGSTKRLKDKYGSAKDILRKTIEQHKSSEPYRVDTTEYFNKLSLFVDIGYKDRVESEITCLAKYFDEKSNGNFRVAIDHLLDINLGIEKLHYFESSPRALSKLAFEEQGWLLIKYNIENFMDTIPNDLMRKRFFDRVDECSMSEEVNEALASWFQSKYKMGALESITYHNAKEVVMYIEHCPSVGLSWLKESILSASPEQLNQFHGTFGRRNVVWTCEHLANFREWFFDCEEILYKLAQNENEKGISNNSQGVWSSMFSPILSNTEVSFYERFELLVSRALQCDKEDEFDMFRVAFTSALNLEGGIRMSPPQMVGGFITPPNWKPQTLEEMMDILKLFLNKVSASFSEFSSIMKKCIIEVLSNTIYNFLPFGLLSLLKEVMNEMLQTQNQKNEFIIKLEWQLRLLDKHKDTAADIISDINCWIDELQDRSLKGRVNNFLVRNVYSYGYTDAEKMKWEDELTDLANKIFEDELRDNILEEITVQKEFDNESMDRLAEAIAKIDRGVILSDFVVYLLNNNMCGSFVRGYFSGAYSLERQLPNKLWKVLDEFVAKESDFVIWASTTMDITKNGYSRILRLIHLSDSISAIANMRFEEWFAFLNAEQKIQLLTELSYSDNKQKYILCFVLISGWLAQGDDFDELYSISIDIFKNCLKEDGEYEIYNIEETFKRFPAKYHNDVIELVVALFDFIESYSYINSHVINIINTIQNEENEPIIMECLGEKLISSEESIKGFAMRGFFNRFSIQVVLDWIKEDGLRRAPMIAYHLNAPTLTDRNLSPLTEIVLKEYDTEEVSKSFIMGEYNFRAYSPEDYFNQKEAWFQLFSSYENYEILAIKNWSAYEKNHIEDICKWYENDEAERARYE